MHAPRATTPLLPAASLTAAALLWGSAFVAMKHAIAVFDPIVVVFGRLLLASLVLAPIAWRLHPHQSPRPGDLKLLLLMGLGEPCLYFVLEGYALTLTSASQAGMVASTLPLMIALAAAIFLRERISRRTLAGCVLALAGVLWLTGAGQADATAPNPALGNLLEVMAMASATCYMIIGKHLSARYSPLYLTACMAMEGTLFFLPLLFLPTTTLPTAFPFSATASIAFLGIGVTLLAYLCYNYGNGNMPASKAGVFINLVPVAAVALAWLLLGETFTPQQFLASGLVLAGVLISQDSRPA